jgi:hypothetical protein
LLRHKKLILTGATAYRNPGLVDGLGMGSILLSGHIVTFIDQDPSIVFNNIRIWRAGPSAHQDHACVAT